LRKKAAQGVGAARRLFFAGLKPCASTERQSGVEPPRSKAADLKVAASPAA